MRGAKTLLTTGVDAMNNGASGPTEVFKSAVKPTLSTFINLTHREIARELSPAAVTSSANTGTSQLGTYSFLNST